jgi:transcriptional regulator with XRE-family HTH domain
VNANLLKSYLVRSGDTQKELARYMGISQSALNAKINGHIEFRQGEMNFIKMRYELSADEVNGIFFNEKVSQ